MAESNYADDFITDSGSTPAQLLKTQPAVLSIGRHKWLLGMRWRSYEVMPERNELVDEASNMGADWIARRSGDEAIQVGFCKQASEDWPTKIFSLAALLADSHRVPWAGAFNLGDGRWWYIAVRDNYGMMPDGDVIGTYEDIQHARGMHASLEDFNLVDGTREDLEKLIESSAGRRTPIESLVGRRFSVKRMASVGIAALIVAGTIGGYAYYEHIQTQVRMAIAKNMANSSKSASPGTQAPDVATTLQAIPDPAVWLEACRRVVQSQAPSLHGWNLVSHHCTGNQDQITWSRGAEATIAYTPPGVISADGDTDNESIALPIPPNSKWSDRALTLVQERTEFILWGQVHNIRISFDAPQITTTTNGSAANAPAKPAPSSQNLHFTVPAAPFALDFSGIDGFRLTEVVPTANTSASGTNANAKSAGSDDNGWTIKGTLYGR